MSSPLTVPVDLRVHLTHATQQTPQALTGAVERCWSHADDGARPALVEVVRTLDAQVAFAAAMGNLDEFAYRPEHALWQMHTNDTSTRFGLRKLRAEMAVAPVGSPGVLTTGC